MRTTGNLINQTCTDDLSERITVFFQTTQRNDRGDIIGVENNVRCVVSAKVLPITSTRLNDDSEIVNKISYRLTIRYRNDIAPDDIISWSGKKLKQVAPPYDAESRRIWTVLTCEELIPDARIS